MYYDLDPTFFSMHLIYNFSVQIYCVEYLELD